MTRRVLVVGAGLSGVAAAWAAAVSGSPVTVVSDRPGATELSSGAVDDLAIGDASERPLEPELMALSEALGLWHLGERSVWVATPAGTVRPARGRERALLDLAPLAGRTVGVVDSGSPGCDARLLARGLGQTPWARATGSRFAAVTLDDAATLREISRIGAGRPPASAGASAQLAAALLASGGDCAGWLWGSGTALDADTVGAVAAATGRPFGLVTSRPGGGAGARYACARDALLESLGVARIDARVTALRRGAQGPELEITRGEAPGRPEALSADAIVLAVGGLVAGGLALVASGDGARPAFQLGLEAPLELALRGRRLEALSSCHAPDLVALGREALARIGVAADDEGRALPARVSVTAGGSLADRRPWVAGDVVADRPRTQLEAARSGIRAGRAAAGSAPPRPPT